MNFKMLKAFISFIFISAAVASAINVHRQAYVVYMGSLPKLQSHEILSDHHHSILANAVGNEELAKKAKIYSYGRSFNGFAARLLPHEAKKLAKEKRVVSVFRSKIRKLQTTRSWDFLGLSEAASRRNAAVESNIIVGLLDTGIWMEGPSFNDHGYGPIPSKWKGKCQIGHNFTGCNRKVIGAQYFNLERTDDTINQSPADEIGHGSHCASTAAGSAVRGASLYGVAKGTARGGVPGARIAMYKVCWSAGCTDTDLLAGFDHAIADGVDVLSVSVGGAAAVLFEDPIAIGSFHAMERGILTSCAGGNDGPELKTVGNVAPWIMTVAASTIDRDFSTLLVLGNNNKVSGESINTFSPKKKMYPLISGANAGISPLDPGAKWCDDGSLDKEKVKGKIVYCLGPIAEETIISDLGGAGLIVNLMNSPETAITTPLPSTHISDQQSSIVEAYINSTKHPRAVIMKTTSKKANAPFLAYFSSRGPQLVARDILKPDISAPGENILAAFTKLATITKDRHAAFSIISGTSMACPHAAAAAAYLKSFHPLWSPAAIKSALMTTATPLKNGKSGDELGAGAGQINPMKAVHPGLVFDLTPKSYLSFLCTKIHYAGTAIEILAGVSFNCSSSPPAAGSDGLNYPTMYAPVTWDATNVSAVFHRIVTHVGFGPSSYKAKIKSPRGLRVSVWPDTLVFGRAYEKRSFKVTVEGAVPAAEDAILKAELVWDDSTHYVRIPILVSKD